MLTLKAVNYVRCGHNRHNKRGLVVQRNDQELLALFDTVCKMMMRNEREKNFDYIGFLYINKANLPTLFSKPNNPISHFIKHGEAHIASELLLIIDEVAEDRILTSNMVKIYNQRIVSELSNNNPLLIDVEIYNHTSLNFQELSNALKINTKLEKLLFHGVTENKDDYTSFIDSLEKNKSIKTLELRKEFLIDGNHEVKIDNDNVKRFVRMLDVNTTILSLSIQDILGIKRFNRANELFNKYIIRNQLIALYNAWDIYSTLKLSANLVKDINSLIMLFVISDLKHFDKNLLSTYISQKNTSIFWKQLESREYQIIYNDHYYYHSSYRG